MKSGVTFRLAVFGIGVGLMGILMVLITIGSQHQGDELRSRLNTIDSESFGISEHFKDQLREINNQRLHAIIDHNPATWDKFLNDSHQLDLWLGQQAGKLRTDYERSVLEQARAAFDDYLKSAQALHAALPASEPQTEAQTEFNFRTKSQHLFDLGQNLAKAHYDSRNELLAHANQTLTRLRQLTLALIALLFLFGIALAVLAYRDLILPLRVKLVESQSLIERNEKLASLGLLAAGVAHEVRNPLTAIKAAVYMQQKKFQPGSPERADAEVVQREILRLERIVTEFLQFARPAEPQMVLTPATAPLKDVQILLGPELSKSNIKMTVEDSSALQINADPEQLKQVLINLVQNAADSIERDGSINLRARADRKPLGNAEKNVVILEVADTGKGIAPDVEKRLFDPFFTTKSTGTGLGLSIAALLVQKHGGALQYQTQVNRGTTFGIVLPEAKR